MTNQPVASQHSCQSPANIPVSRQPTFLFSRQPTFLPVASQHSCQSPANIPFQSTANIPISRQPTFLISGHPQLSTLAHPPPPLSGSQGSMAREEPPAQPHPSPHRGVEGPQRASAGLATTLHPCPPASLLGVIGRTSWRGSTQQFNSSPPRPITSPGSPTWANVARGNVNIRAAEHTCPSPQPAVTAADFTALYDRCMASSFKARITISHAAGNQVFTVLCNLPAPAVMNTAAAEGADVTPPLLAKNRRNHLPQSLLPAVIQHCRLPHRCLLPNRYFPRLRSIQHRRKELDEDEMSWNKYEISRRRASYSSHLCLFRLRDHRLRCHRRHRRRPCRPLPCHRPCL